MTSADATLLGLVADLRAALGDPEGRLMQDELIDHARALREDAQRYQAIRVTARGHSPRMDGTSEYLIRVPRARCLDDAADALRATL